MTVILETKLISFFLFMCYPANTHERIGFWWPNVALRLHTWIWDLKAERHLLPAIPNFSAKIYEITVANVRVLQDLGLQK